MKKTYVIDTNVILQSPTSLFAFEDNIVVIPAAVIEELDRFKKENSERGFNAREAARILDQLKDSGDIMKGITINEDGLLMVALNYIDVKLPYSWDEKNNDNKILRVCKGLVDNRQDVYLVSKDIFARIKADILGIKAQDYYNEQVKRYDEQYKGVIEVYTKSENIDQFYKNKRLGTESIYLYEDEKEIIPSLTVNEFLIMHSDTDKNKSALGRFNGKEIVSLNFANEKPFSVSPRSAMQKFMQEALLMDANIAPLVVFKGPAGTAKTFYSLAVGLHKVLNYENREYRKILVCRPNVHMDEDIGFLPGSEQEKIAPYLRPVIDNLEILIDNDEEQRYKSEGELKDKMQELFDRNIISTEAIAFIRGRSIVKQFIIIDEAQNLTPRQVKGIITRAGKGTKIVLIGDPEQIDQPYLDERTNGLCYAADRMRGSNLCYQITLTDKDCVNYPLEHESSNRM